ncbi:MAG: STAS domain-containing protein [Bryobacteraceae bacterium]|jgi:anti-anti-sigma factor
MAGPALFEAEQRGDIGIVRISGRLATGADIDFSQKAREIKSLGCGKLVVEIGGVDSTGSSGIGFFVDLYTSIAKNPAGRFVLAGPSPRVLEVLRITRLSTVIPIARNLEEGLAFCAREEGTASHAH